MNCIETHTMRSASTHIWSRLRSQRCKVLVIAKRSLAGGSSVNEEVSLTELAETTNTDQPLFGIAPRKLRNEEDEDFVSTSPHPPKLPADQENYFSQTWAEQKFNPFVDCVDENLVLQPPSAYVSPLEHPTPTQNLASNRVWLLAPKLSIQETFTFASFKVLASVIARRHRQQLYTYITDKIMDWGSRRKKIVAELELCSADIICIQEVDRFNELQSDLSTKGYVGLYKVSIGVRPTGCAIFWKENRFKLLHEESLEFSSLGMKENIAQLCVLQSIVPGNLKMDSNSNTGESSHSQSKCLIVGNIDILFNPKRGDVKLGQCRTFLKQAYNLSRLWPGAPLIIGGSFYCTPHSAVYKFLAESELDVFGLQRQYLSGQLSKSADGGTTSLGTSSATMRTEEENLNLSNRLRKSLMASRISSKQGSEFVNSAKEVLNIPTGSDCSSASKFDNEGALKDKHASAKTFISKTIEILESSLNSQAPMKHVLEKKIRVPTFLDVSPCMMHTDPTSASTDCLSMGQSDSTVQAGSTSESAHPLGDGMESPMNASEHSNDEVSKRNFESGTVPAAAQVDSMKECRSFANSPVQSTTPEHGWDPNELKVATGTVDNTVVKHELNLSSVYPEIQSDRGTRDAKGEPLATMHHREFTGTVDYIWRSEGLKTTKVLDTVPLKEMLKLPGLPSQVYGSDHICLACELAFLPG